MNLFHPFPARSPEWKSVFVISVLLASLSDVMAKAVERVYDPAPALALYLWKTDDVPEAAGIRLYNKNAARGDRISIRLFDPEEQLVWRQHLEPGQRFLRSMPGSLEIDGLKPDGPLSDYTTIEQPGRAGALTATKRFLLDQPGVWQFRLVAGDRSTMLQLDTSGDIRHGVSFQNGMFSPWRSDLTEVWFHIPPNAQRLQLRRPTGIEIYDQHGEKVFPLDTHDLARDVILSIDETDVVWQMRFPDPASWGFAAFGIPLILCEDADTARALRAGVEVLDDGTVVSHKFQRRLAEMLPGLLAPAKVGDTDALIAEFDGDPEAWFQDDPRRNLQLLRPYGLFPHVLFALREQNLDTNDHWSGTIGREAWDPLERPDGRSARWDGFWGVSRGQGRSGTSPRPYAKYLAYAYHLDAPMNPFFGRPEMLYRTAAAALRDLMLLNEAEIFPGSGSDLNVYPGFPGFVIGGRHFPEFALAAPYLPDAVRDIWADGLRRFVDRYWPENLVTTRNQSAHFLKAFQYFAMGTGEAIDRELALRFANRFAQGAQPAGYHMEAGGPCGTYPGIQHWYMAAYYRLSGDDTILESVRRSYDFYNHTVAPEPNGRAYGGYNYSHRIAQGFHDEQYSGARGMLADLLPEVGLWRAPTPPDDPAREQAAARLRAAIERPLTTDVRTLELGFFRYLHWPESIANGMDWPARRPPFIREFADELIAVKRSNWYAAFFVGKPARDPFYLYGAHGGAAPGQARPYNGGGVTLFWTPALGNVLLAGKTAFTQHGVVAVGEDGLRRSEDYFHVDPTLDLVSGTLTVRGRIEETPLTYRRTYVFHDDRLSVELELTATAAYASERLVENIPLAAGPFKANGTTLLVRGKEEAYDPGELTSRVRTYYELGADSPDGKVLLTTSRADGFTLVDAEGHGVAFQFDRAHPLRICRWGPTSGAWIRHNRVEIELPTRFETGQTVTISYDLVPEPLAKPPRATRRSPLRRTNQRIPQVPGGAGSVLP